MINGEYNCQPILPQISVVVPVYNSERYLAQCIESILSQTYRKLELILVNDGSTDKSGTICEEYSKKDDRIKVIHTPNSGVSAARNIGIHLANGEFITFMDSDDFAGSALLEKMVETIEETDSDMCVAGFFTFYNQDSQIEHVLNLAGSIKMEEFVMKYFEEAYQKDLLSGPCHKLFRRKIIYTHNLRYDDKYSICEDGIFSYTYLSYCQTITFLPFSLYYYRQRTGEEHLMAGYYPNSFDALTVYYDSVKHILAAYNAQQKTMQMLDRSFLNRYLDYLGSVYRTSNLAHSYKYNELIVNANNTNFRKLIAAVPSTSLSRKEVALIALILANRLKVIHWYWSVRRYCNRRRST